MKDEVIRKIKDQWPTIKEFARFVEIPYSTLMDKLNGRTPFTVEEAVRVKRALGAGESIEVLFGLDLDGRAAGQERVPGKR